MGYKYKGSRPVISMSLETAVQVTGSGDRTIFGNWNSLKSLYESELRV